MMATSVAGPEPARARSNTRPISASRGRPLADDAPRPLSRSRALSRTGAAGKRRARVWLNEHMVHAYAVWGRMIEDDASERLAHMYLSPPSGPTFEGLFDPENEDVLKAFRTGAFGMETIEALRRKQAVLKASSGSRKRVTVGAAMTAMFARVERHLRVHALREARRSRGSGASVQRGACVPLLMALEEVVQRWLEDVADAPAPDAHTSYAHECSDAYVMRVKEVDSLNTALTGRIEMQLRDGAAALRLPLRESYHRLLMHALAEFYGVKSRSEDAADGDRCLVLCTLLPSVAASAAAADADVALHDAADTAGERVSTSLLANPVALIPALRAQLAAAAADGAADVTFVPLFHLHAWSLPDAESDAAGATKRVKSRGGAASTAPRQGSPPHHVARSSTPEPTDEHAATGAAVSFAL